MRAFAQTLSFPLIAFLLQSVVIAGLALLAGHFAAKRGAAFRVAVYRSGILAILVLMVLGPAMRMVVRPWYEVTRVSATANDVPANATTSTIQRRHVAQAPEATIRLAESTLLPNGKQAQPVFHEPHDASSVPAATSLPPAYGLFGAIFLAGSALVLGAVLVGLSWVASVRGGARTAKEAELSITLRLFRAQDDGRRIRVAISPRVRSAFAAGVFQPTIYLPAGMEGEFVPDQVAMVVRHEWIHVRQGDCLWALLSRFCCAVSWLNPLTWVLAQKLNLASEELCDELVLASGVEPAAYADCLLRIAESMLPPSAARLVGAGVFPTRSHLSRRISLMLNNPSKSSTVNLRQTRLKVAALAAVAACGACMIVSASPLNGARHDATPEATISAWFDAVNQRNWSGVFSRIEGAKVDLAVSAFSKAPEVMRFSPKMTALLSDLSISGDLATVHVTENGEHARVGVFPPKREELVELKRTDGDWKIVRGGTKDSFIEEMVEVSKDPALMARAVAASQQTVMLSSIKQIALGVIMYLNDHNDTFSMTQATLKNSVKKYIKDDKVWLGPNGKPLDIRINPNLLGKSETAIPAPATCVLLSIGPQGSLQFIHDRTVVAFVDGHVKGMNQVSAAHLSWK